MPDEDGYNDPNHLLEGTEKYHQEKYKKDWIPMNLCCVS